MRTICNLTACFEFLDRGGIRPLRGDLRVPRARQNDGRALRLKKALEFAADAQGYGLLHNSRRTDGT